MNRSITEIEENAIMHDYNYISMAIIGKPSMNSFCSVMSKAIVCILWFLHMLKVRHLHNSNAVLIRKYIQKATTH